MIVCWCPVLKGHQLLELEPPLDSFICRPAEGEALRGCPGGQAGAAALRAGAVGMKGFVVVDPNMCQVGRMHVSHYTVTRGSPAVTVMAEASRGC